MVIVGECWWLLAVGVWVLVVGLEKGFSLQIGVLECAEQEGVCEVVKVLFC